MSSRLTWAAQPDPCCSCAGKEHGLESIADKEETEERLERPEKPLSSYVQTHTHVKGSLGGSGSDSLCGIIKANTKLHTLGPNDHSRREQKGSERLSSAWLAAQREQYSTALHDSCLEP